jgi:hypothetical protein
MSVPVPMYSKEWRLVNIRLILRNSIALFSNNSYGINSSNVTVVIPEGAAIGGVAVETV